MSAAGKTLRDGADLVAAGLADAGGLPALQRVAAQYAVAITPAMAELIDPADSADPIARQFVPAAAELETRPEERADPIGDAAHSPVAGLVHRYPDRVLLKLVNVCPVYCRFCFRRAMVGPGKAATLAPEAVAAALDYIAGQPQIWEVIVSGGDPFVLSARRIAAFVQALARLSHVKVVRWHTRVPVVAPERVTAGLVRALKAAGQASYVVVHVNHPRELAPAARRACARLVDGGIPMLAQTVLLRGVNDDAETLARLMRALVETRVKPYYLHHADLAPGTAGMRTTMAQGQRLLRGLRGRLSGLCQPTYVLDIPGGYGKSPIGPVYVEPLGQGGDGACLVEDYQGGRHIYPPPAADG